MHVNFLSVVIILVCAVMAEFLPDAGFWIKWSPCRTVSFAVIIKASTRIRAYRQRDYLHYGEAIKYFMYSLSIFNVQSDHFIRYSQDDREELDKYFRSFICPMADKPFVSLACMTGMLPIL